MSSAESSAICLKCHEGTQGRGEERFNFRRSEHFRHGVSCNDCHSSHAPKRTEFLLKASEPGMCYQCHADQKASFAKPFHHKVPEGGMKCSDCHNQHGGFMSKSLRNSVNGDSACVKCHSDKQGPFIYEHAPVKIEGCQACHTPHGSTNPKLLTRNVVKFLCFFLTGAQERRGDSLYYARLHSVFANTRFGLTNRLDLLMVYYYIVDRGAPPVSIGPNDFVSAFPLRRHNPEVRLAYRFSNNVTGNVAYRHYSYNERDFAVQDYRANILTTSLRFTF